MSIYVMDANSLLASLRNEPGGSVADGLLADPNADCLAHSVNLCEIFYDTLRQTDLATAQLTISDLLALGLTERPDMDTEFWQLIGQLKVSPGRISLADCFTLALAIRTGGILVTSDHHEFDVIVPLGLCPILFVR